MMDIININEVKATIAACTTLQNLNDIRNQYLGKKGLIALEMAKISQVEAAQRAAFGQKINQVKQEIAELIDSRKNDLEQDILNQRLATETIDISLKGNDYTPGAKHILTSIIDDLSRFFIGMGYLIEEGPEVESDHYNFEMLNLPKDHPARDMQDTFYFDETTLLRTHTSPVQARTLLKAKGKGPVKIICPGKVYRRDDDDATHSHQFTQIEGLLIDTNVTMADLKGTLELMAQHLFGEKRQIRLRSSFFPFTEPSVEVDVSCFICEGKGCNLCKHSGWIEILGAGMVHPNVLEMAGFDSKIYQGFAFGAGIERIAMLKYGIADIRHFYNNDIRIIRQFVKER